MIRFDRGRIGKGTADPKQQSRYGQDCDRQHKAPSHALQNAKNLILHFQFSFFHSVSRRETIIL